MRATGPRRGVILTLFVTLLFVFTSSTVDARIVTGNAKDNFLKGSNKRDTLKGKGGSDLMFGKRGNDKLVAGPNDAASPLDGDLLFLGAGKDTGKGGSGADVIVDDDSDGKVDTLIGGGGINLMAGADGSPTIFDCSNGTDIVIKDADDTTIGACENVMQNTDDVNGSVGFLRVGTSGNDTLNGTPTFAGEAFVGKAGDDTINGNDNTDIIAGGGGADIMNGEAGNDQIVDDDGTDGDVLNGGDGDDQLVSIDGAADTITCGDGIDVVFKDKKDVLTDPENCDFVNTYPAPV